MTQVGLNSCEGHFSFHWAQIQQTHADDSADICSKSSSGDSWLKQVLHHVSWSHLCHAWKLREADPRGIDKADQDLKHKAKLRPNVVALCQSSAKLDHLNNRLFGSDLNKRLDDTGSSKQTAWIQLVKPLSKSWRDLLQPLPTGPQPPVDQPERLPTPRLRDS
jgi:hypothetical protein